MPCVKERNLYRTRFSFFIIFCLSCICSVMKLQSCLWLLLTCCLCFHSVFTKVRLVTHCSYPWLSPPPTETWGFCLDIGGRCGALLLSPERTLPSSCRAARRQLWRRGNPSLSNPVGLLCMVVGDGDPLCVFSPCARNRLGKSKNTKSWFRTLFASLSISGKPL
jgi:hypothetical protein